MNSALTSLQMPHLVGAFAFSTNFFGATLR
jgi:hypothetical protein